jgi:hypothetical protein
MKSEQKQFKKKHTQSFGYQLWKKQLQALKKNDWYTVKQLAQKAREQLQPCL